MKGVNNILKVDQVSDEPLRPCAGAGRRLTVSGTGHHQVPLVEGALGLGLSSTNETAEDRTWACEPLVNPEAVAGKYCVVDRGECSPPDRPDGPDRTDAPSPRRWLLFSDEARPLSGGRGHWHRDR